MKSVAHLVTSAASTLEDDHLLDEDRASVRSEVLRKSPITTQEIAPVSSAIALHALPTPVPPPPASVRPSSRALEPAAVIRRTPPPARPSAPVFVRTSAIDSASPADATVLIRAIKLEERARSPWLFMLVATPIVALLGAATVLALILLR